MLFIFLNLYIFNLISFKQKIDFTDYLLFIILGLKALFKNQKAGSNKQVLNNNIKCW
jgi:hypothetical protein